jgi:hypothetical protein
LDAALRSAAPPNVTWILRHFPGEDHATTVPPTLHAALRWLESTGAAQSGRN